MGKGGGELMRLRKGEARGWEWEDMRDNVNRAWEAHVFWVTVIYRHRHHERCSRISSIYFVQGTVRYCMDRFLHPSYRFSSITVIHPCPTC